MGHATPELGEADCACHPRLEGTVRVKLYKGNVTVTGRKSPYSLYDKLVASFEDDGGLYNQADAGECRACGKIRDYAGLYI